MAAVDDSYRIVASAEETAWDGDGVDPWLPERLADQVDVVSSEASIRDAFWAALSGWLMGVKQRIIIPLVRPDPAVVWTTVPEWEAAVHEVVRGPVLETLGLAYRPLLGDDYRFDSRPAVVEHLASVTNRMVRTSDSVFTMITEEISRGANLGEAIPEISNRVERVLSTTDTERWPNRSTVVARTETMSALNTGREDAFNAVAEALGAPFEKMWLATLDGRTRPTHRRADGQRVPVGGMFTVGGASLRRPGDPFAPGKETIQCRCTLLLLEPGENVDVTRRPFRA